MFPDRLRIHTRRSPFQVQGSRFKSYNILIFQTPYSIVWIDLFHPLGETRNSARLTHNAIDRDQLGHPNRER